MLKISRSSYEALRRHAEETYPHECCGALIGEISGDVRMVRDAVRCNNDKPAADWYSIDPRELVRIQREAAQSGADIIGFYHSHPDDRAQWSASDLAEAHWMGCSYVITAVEKGRAAETNSFALTGSDEDDKHFENEPVEILLH